MAEEGKVLPTEQAATSTDNKDATPATTAGTLTDIIIAAIPKLGEDDRKRIAEAAIAVAPDNSVTACATIGPDGIPVAGAVASNGGLAAAGAATIDPAAGTANIAGAAAAAPPAPDTIKMAGATTPEAAEALAKLGITQNAGGRSAA